MDLGVSRKKYGEVATDYVKKSHACLKNGVCFVPMDEGVYLFSVRRAEQDPVRTHVCSVTDVIHSDGHMV